MNRCLSFFIVAVCLVAPGSLFAAERAFCQAPATDCTPDPLFVRFGDVANRASELTGAAVDQEFDIHVTIDATSDQIQGWNYAVKHDPTQLQVLSMGIMGLGLPPVLFTFEGLAAGDPRPGYVSAVVLLVGPGGQTVLPVGNDQRLSTARYKVLTSISDTQPSLIEFADRELRLSPTAAPVAVSLTVATKTLRPSTVTDGEVLGVGGPAECDAYGYYFGPAAGTAPFEVTGNSMAISMRNAGPALAFSMGVSRDGANLSFADQVLGKRAESLVELNVTDNDGVAWGPPDLLTNTATLTDPANQTVASIALGADAGQTGTQECGGAPIETGFFFAVDCAPPIGGPGFTVAYVGSIGEPDVMIPATGDGDPCPVNEILVVNFGVGPPPGEFSRGDTNGDGRLNITDGVICAQNIFRDRLVMFDCMDMLDANNDGELNMADPVAILSWVFLNAPDLAPPFRTCGMEEAGDTTMLGCNAPNCTP